MYEYKNVLTCTVLSAPVLGHCYLPVYDGLALQNILIVPIRQGLLIGLRAVMLCPVATATASSDLGEDGSFIKESQVSLKVKVSVQVLLRPVSEALAVPLSPRPASTSILDTVLP